MACLSQFGEYRLNALRAGNIIRDGPSGDSIGIAVAQSTIVLIADNQIERHRVDIAVAAGSTQHLTRDNVLVMLNVPVAACSSVVEFNIFDEDDPAPAPLEDLYPSYCD